MKDLVVIQDDGDWKHILWHCDGCNTMHAVPVKGTKGPIWDWNGSLTSPTLSPSVSTKREGLCCHIFMRNGVVEFLSDCTHDKANKQIPLIPHGEWS